MSERVIGNDILDIDGPYICRTKQGREPHALLGISWYHRMFDAIAEVLHKLKLI
jgi:hypothetical protein